MDRADHAAADNLLRRAHSGADPDASLGGALDRKYGRPDGGGADEVKEVRHAHANDRAALLSHDVRSAIGRALRALS